MILFWILTLGVSLYYWNDLTMANHHMLKMNYHWPMLALATITIVISIYHLIESIKEYYEGKK